MSFCSVDVFQSSDSRRMTKVRTLRPISHGNVESSKSVTSDSLRMSCMFSVLVDEAGHRFALLALNQDSLAEKSPSLSGPRPHWPLSKGRFHVNQASNGVPSPSHAPQSIATFSHEKHAQALFPPD